MVDSRHALGAKQDPVIETDRCGGQGGAQQNSQLLSMVTGWIMLSFLKAGTEEQQVQQEGASGQAGTC